MTLAQRLDAKKAAALAPKRELRTLVIDIERIPGVARIYDPRQTYVPPSNWQAWPYTVCFAAKWLGSPDITFASVWEQGADEMHRIAFDLLHQADLCVTFNGVKFDVKHLRSGFAERRMGEPAPWKDIDLLRVVRSKLGWESKSLDQVCKRLDVKAKNDHWDWRVAEAAVAGDTAAQAKCRRYNENDPRITEAVYWALLPYISGHPHVAPSLGLERPTCPRCGTTKVTRTGSYTPGVFTYARYTCQVDGGHFKTTFESRGPSVRAL